MRSQSLVLAGTSDTVVSRLDPRVKIVLLVAFIAVLSLWKSPSPLRLFLTATFLLALTLLARLSLSRVLIRGFLVLPFVGFFALVLYLSGQPARALLILEKTCLSTWSVLIVVLSTAASKLISAARDLRVPSLLSEVMQLTFRYLFVLKEEAVAMQTAFRSRAGGSGLRAVLASSGMIAGLFMRSQQRAERIYFSMLSRGYTGLPQQTQTLTAQPMDYLVLLVGLLVFVSTLIL